MGVEFSGHFLSLALGYSCTNEDILSICMLESCAICSDRRIKMMILWVCVILVPLVCGFLSEGAGT